MQGGQVSQLPRAEDTSFCTKIRKALGKKPKKGRRKLRTSKSATQTEEESEHLFYFLGHLLRANKRLRFLGISVHFFFFWPRKGHRELCQQVLKLLKIPRACRYLALQAQGSRRKQLKVGFHSAIMRLGSWPSRPNYTVRDCAGRRAAA